LRSGIIQLVELLAHTRFYLPCLIWARLLWLIDRWRDDDRTHRRRLKRFANRSAEEVEQVGINEYRAGAGIGWHRDKPEFGDVIGVSLLIPAKMRLRKQNGKRWERSALVLQPRSIYALSGAARREWEHSIPPVEELRYSIMFRTLADNETFA
jgi:alkylated DNA repair dioxygenase AlkB